MAVFGDLLLEKDAYYVPTICQTQDMEKILESGLPQFMVDKALSVKEIHLEAYNNLIERQRRGLMDPPMFPPWMKPFKV